MAPFFANTPGMSRINLSFRLCILIIFGAIFFNYHVGCASNTEREIWRQYRPLAMDEGWTVSGNRRGRVINKLLEDSRNTHGRRDGFMSNSMMSDQMMGEPTIDEPMTNLDPLPGTSSPGLPMTPGTIKQYGGIKSVTDWRGEDVKNVVFRLPDSDKESAALTRLLTEQKPNFLVSDVAKPINMTIGKEPGDEKVLATYNIFVPIFVPAVKRKVQSQAGKQEIRFVEEKVTEMRPMKSMVPVVKEVIKPEVLTNPGPHKVVTNYVMRKDARIPSRVDPILRPEDNLLTSTVQNAK